jgi:hypothetical protein
MEGSCPADGHPDLVSAYCAEIGFIAVLHILLTICKYYKLMSGSFLVIAIAALPSS